MLFARVVFLSAQVLGFNRYSEGREAADCDKTFGFQKKGDTRGASKPVRPKCVTQLMLLLTEKYNEAKKLRLDRKRKVLVAMRLNVGP